MILCQGEPVEYFFMIQTGEVEIIVRHRNKEMQLARLGPGQFFGEVELTQGGHAIAHAQASEHGAELALLPRQVFYELIDGSPLTRHNIRETAATRLAENRRRKSDR
jgi:CRP/FNR family transcriptional regulator, cyclic AMP receptor protein